MSWDLLLVNPALLHVSNLLLSFHCFWNFHAHGYYSCYKESLVPLCCLKIAFIKKINNYSKVTRGSKRKLQKINNIKEAPLQFINEKTVFPEWILCALGFPGDSVLKDLPANAGAAGNAGLTPGSGTSPWRRKWQPTPRLLLGKSRRQRKLESYSPWGCKESDTTERLSRHASTICTICVGMRMGRTDMGDIFPALPKFKQWI